MMETQGRGSQVYTENVLFENGRIYPTYWNKNDTYHFHNDSDINYSFKAINDSIDYASIITFKRNTKQMAEIEAFYKEHFSTIKKPNLILDFRNNTGGSLLQAEPLLKIIKENKLLKRIYVMMNCYTSSATELTIMELMKDLRVVLVGENSNGSCAYSYGNNSISIKSNCSAIRTSFTKKRMLKDVYKYEGIGISPDHQLSIESNWVDQVIELISGN